MHYFCNIYSAGWGYHQVIFNTHLRIQRLGDHFGGLSAALQPLPTEAHAYS